MFLGVAHSSGKTASSQLELEFGGSAQEIIGSAKT